MSTIPRYYFGPQNAALEADKIFHAEVLKAGYVDYHDWMNNDKNTFVKTIVRIGKEVANKYRGTDEWWDLPDYKKW